MWEGCGFSVLGLMVKASNCCNMTQCEREVIGFSRGWESEVGGCDVGMRVWDLGLGADGVGVAWPDSGVLRDQICTT